MWEDGVIRWFKSICDSVTSKSLSIEVHGFDGSDTWLVVQDTLVALNARIGTLLVYLSSNLVRPRGGKLTKKNIRRLLPRLYKAGIKVVVQQHSWMSEDEMVCDCISTYLLFSLPPRLASLSFPSMRLPSFSRTS